MLIDVEVGTEALPNENIIMGCTNSHAKIQVFKSNFELITLKK